MDDSPNLRTAPAILLFDPETLALRVWRWRDGVARPLDRTRLVRGLTVAGAVALAYAPCLLMIVGRTGDWGVTGWLKWEPSMLLQLLPLYSVPFEVLTVGSAVAALILLLLVKRAV